MKKVIAACIDRVLEFDTQNEAAKYIETLRDKGSEFRILIRQFSKRLPGLMLMKIKIKKVRI